MATPRRWADPLLAATLLCGLNALKPPVADDPAYLAYARQIAAHPGDPYGFTIHWYDEPQAAMTVLAPPVFPYWLGLGVRLFGDDPTVLKLWCWPWCFALAAGLHDLLRRFAPGVERPMQWFIVLSPAVLPGVNLMLDVPALALSLLAVAAMFDVIDRWSLRTAAVVGLVVGLAMQTKYTAFTTPVALLLVAALYGRESGLPVGVAIVCAIVVFQGWEAIVEWQYGMSHCTYHATHGVGTARRVNLIGPLVTLVGGVGGALLPLGLTAWRASGRVVASSIAIIVASYAWIAFAPAGSALGFVSRETLTFGATGIAVLGLLAATGVAAWRDSSRIVGGPVEEKLMLTESALANSRGYGRFLAAWLAIEVVGYFALTPWPAARRVLAVVVVGSMLLAWLAARGGRAKGQVQRLYASALLSAGLGLLYQAVDADGACATRSAVRDADAWLRSRGDALPVRFVGRHGLQYEAERAGWWKYPAWKNGIRLNAWYLVTDGPDAAAKLDLSPPPTLLRTFEADGWLPLSTQPSYSGMKVPMQRRHGPTIMLLPYRYDRGP